jgi:hypothetical protein
MNPKLAGVIFDVQGNASEITFQFKLNVEQCPNFLGNKFKDNPAGATAAIRTRTAPANIKPTTPMKRSV